MLKAFFSSEDEETGIDWLDIAIQIANEIVAHIIQEIEHREMEDWQSGNAIVLKTIEP